MITTISLRAAAAEGARIGALAASLLAVGLDGAAAQTMPSSDALRRELAARGYTEIRIETLDRRRAVVVVCSGDRRERLQFDRTLRARFLEQIGACGGGAGGSAPAAFGRAARDLERMGFVQTVFEDEVGGEIGVTACREDLQYRARYGANGALIDLFQIGRCPAFAAGAAFDPRPTPPAPAAVAGVVPGAGFGGMTGGEVVEQLTIDGYSEVFLNLQRADALYEMSACFGDRRYTMLVDDRAVIQAQAPSGFCLSQSRFD